MITPPLGVKSHAGIDRFAAFDRGDVGAIAEMGDDQAIRQIAGKLMHDRFAGQAVKPVAMNTLRLQCFGDRKHTSDLGHFGVKCGVETCRLRKAGKMLLGEADHRQSRRRVQRCEGGSGFQQPQHRLINQAMLPQLRPTMYDPVPDGGR